MNTLKYIAVNIVSIAIRLFPFPMKTGLIRLGNPQKDSPVLLTCNFRLTVAQIRRILSGVDAYLLVANSRGINVWCAATGGHFTNHSAISILKTSGIDDLVDHRNLVLPQFAAAGIEAGVVREKTGWNVTWGPVYAKDIPRFLQNGLKKTPDMLEVEFPLRERIVMAVAWAFPISFIMAAVLALLWPDGIARVVLFVWAMSLVLYIAFPLYSHKFVFKRKERILGRFDFAWGGIQLISWGLFMAGLIAYGLITGDFGWGTVIRWAIASAVVIHGLCYDLTGSTPNVKSSHHDDRLRDVALDTEKCNGDGVCARVCPRNCFEIDKENHIATMPRSEFCVQCGACIIQCPGDALCFRSPDGQTIPPQTIRKFKLNLSGKRVVEGARKS